MKAYILKKLLALPLILIGVSLLIFIAMRVLPGDPLSAISGEGGGTYVLSKEQLQAAPSFEPTERTAYMRAKEQASEMGHKAIDKAGELKDMAGKKIEDMRGGPTPK